MLPNDVWLLSTKANIANGRPGLVPGLQPGRAPCNEDLSLVEIMAGFTEHSPQGILLLDENWRITYANGAAQADAHIQPQDLNKRSFWDMYPHSIGTILEQTYRRVAATRKRASFKEYYYAPLDAWFDVDVLPLGRGVGIYFRDVTSRVRLQMARDLANEQLDRVLSAATDSVMSVGRDWRILYMNQHGKDNLAAKGDIVGENLWEVFSDAVFEGSPHIKYHYRAMTEGLPGEFDDYKGPPLNAWYNVIVRPTREGIIIFFATLPSRSAPKRR